MCYLLFLNNTNNNRYAVLYDFDATQEGEISVREGESIEVVESYDDGWSYCKKLSDQSEGLLPTAYYHDEDQSSGSSKSPSSSSSPTSASSLFARTGSGSSPGLILNGELQVEDKNQLSDDKRVSVSASGIKIVRKDVSVGASGSKKNLYSPTGPLVSLLGKQGLTCEIIEIL